MRTRGVRTLAMVALAASLAASATAEVRKLETVGTLPLKASAEPGVIPRDAAIEHALREAVVRIAQEFLADRPLEEPGLAPDDDSVPVLTLQGEVTSEEELAALEAAREEELAELDRVLGKKMVPYTTRFRVIEDRGRRPALFSEDPEVTEEYVVIVEVQIDVERVRNRLVEAGMLDARAGASLANEVLLEVEGLSRYAAYRDFRRLLVEELEVQSVVPVEMEAGRTVFDVSTEVTAVEFLEALLTAAPPHMAIDPRHASGGRLRVAVEWRRPKGSADPAGPASASSGAGRADL